MLPVKKVFHFSPRRLDVAVADLLGDQTDNPIFGRNALPIGRKLELQTLTRAAFRQDASIAAPADVSTGAHAGGRGIDEAHMDDHWRS